MLLSIVYYCCISICPRHPLTEKTAVFSGIHKTDVSEKLQFFTSFMGTSPSRGSHRTAPTCCDGFITLDFMAGQKYHYSSCLSSPSAESYSAVKAYLRGLPIHHRQQKGCILCTDIQFSRSTEEEMINPLTLFAVE